MRFVRTSALLRLMMLLPVWGAAGPTVFAQLNPNCVVSVLNRTVQVSADGTWVLPNIPAGFGLVRARATCVNNGVTTSGQSALFTIAANRMNAIPPITLGPTTPIPNLLTITASLATLTQPGQTAQLTVTATYADNSTKNVTPASTGTQYIVSNTNIATVSANGVVTAVSSGTVLIQAVNEGTQGIITIQVLVSGASHGGIADSWAIANGLDPTDPGLPFEDPDHDGLSNLQEFQIGTDPNNPDTDGDGLTDGQEVLLYHTNPLLFSTDGTGIPDGIEVQTGTLGLSLSQKLAKAISTFTVSPPSFVLNVNTIQGLASQQLSVKAKLVDGKTTLDLTSTQKGTNYTSSDLNICNFGVPDGNVFAGNSGPCTITITNSGFTTQATGTVVTFSPTPLSFVSIPGYANNVAVNGNYAYVAAGAAGLQVVNVTDRNHPNIAASLPLAGNANDVTLVGNLAYVAGGSAGLHVVDVSNPLVPVRVGTLNTGGSALDVMVQGTTAYIANSSNLFIADVTSPTSMAKIGSLALPGTTKALDVDVSRSIVVAVGDQGLFTINVSDPKAPAVLGSLNYFGSPQDVALNGTWAFVADSSRSLTSVDIRNPANPVLGASTDPNLGGELYDVITSNNFALGAAINFINTGVTIVDVSNPPALQPRAILYFVPNGSNGFRNFDKGTGLAADGAYVYLTTNQSNGGAQGPKYGTVGDTRLYIGQYLAIVDNKGIAPTVSITSPATGSTVIQGSKLLITANATDDVAVASVSFLVNGQVVFASTSAPYQYTYTIPTGITTLTLGATAVDFGNLTATAQNVVVNVIPDPGTTVVGRVLDKNQNPVAGATVTTVGGKSSTTGSSGTFSISGVATVLGAISVNATATIGTARERGSSVSVPPVAGGTTNVGDIVIRTVSIVGYYDITLNTGNADQVAPITSAGLQAVNVGDLRTADLSQFDVLFMQNPDNGGFSPIFTSNLSKIQQFISNGGVFILHDRNVSSAGSLLPGSPGTIVRDFLDDRVVNVVDNTTLVTNGPGGVISNGTLSGGTSSSHGFILSSTIPAGARGILSRTDPTHLVLYSYPFGQGKVIYSTIPLDYYLAGFGPPTVAGNMQHYAINVVAYGASIR
jgi:hypothetical protein